MAALTKPRKTPKRLNATYQTQLDQPLAADAVLYVGALAVFNASGFLDAGSVATGLTAAGVVEMSPFGVPVGVYDNTGGSAGDVEARIVKGTFKFENSGSDPIDRSDIGQVCYIEDDQTVSATDGGATQSAAGRILDIDLAADGEPTGAGVWVEIL